jgi:probable HAF family extracellular repeat protein
MRRLLPFFVSGLCLAFAIHGARAQRYTVTDLGTLPGGDHSSGAAINKFGQVTGESNVNPICPDCGPFHAFLYSDRKMIDLGTLPGGTGSSGRGIDEFGRVTGVSNIPGGPISQHAFLYSDGKMTDLGTLSGKMGIFSGGNAISPFGKVTGFSDFPGDINLYFHAFLYSNGAMQDLGTLPMGNNSVGWGVNRFGQVTGGADTPSNPPSLGNIEHAFLYSNGTMSDLGTLPGGNYSRGLAIDRFGDVTGFSNFGDEFNRFHAFLYRNSVMQDLGTLPGDTDSGGQGITGRTGRRREIEERGTRIQIVGISYNTNAAHAFLYSYGEMQDLNSLIPPNSGWVLEQATAINDRGQITGVGTINGHSHAFLLTPVCRDHDRDHDRGDEGCHKEE